MNIVGQAQTLDEQMEVLKENWNDYDFFFIHFKYTDSTGEDGNFDVKVKRTEEVDAIIPRINELDPTVLIVTGDHSTPAFLKNHSWHPVPTLLVAPACRTDACQAFGERDFSSRRTWPVRGKISDEPCLGQRGSAGEIWRVDV